MNTFNLIRLGALAQREFSVREDFEIMEVPDDSPDIVRVAMPVSQSLNILWSQKIVPVAPYDTIELQHYVTNNNHEAVWLAYSYRANVLVIRWAARKE